MDAGWKMGAFSFVACGFRLFAFCKSLIFILHTCSLLYFVTFLTHATRFVIKNGNSGGVSSHSGSGRSSGRWRCGSMEGSVRLKNRRAVTRILGRRQ